MIFHGRSLSGQRGLRGIRRKIPRERKIGPWKLGNGLYFDFFSAFLGIPS